MIINYKKKKKRKLKPSRKTSYPTKQANKQQNFDLVVFFFILEMKNIPTNIVLPILSKNGKIINNISEQQKF